MRGHSGSHPCTAALGSCVSLKAPRGTFLGAGTHVPLRVAYYLAWQIAAELI